MSRGWGPDAPPPGATARTAEWWADFDARLAARVTAGQHRVRTGAEIAAEDAAQHLIDAAEDNRR